MSMTLNQLTAGKIATINFLHGENHALKRQCGALGLKPGEQVKVLHRSGGTGPMQIKCRGTLFAIRNDEAASIGVTLEA
ncbi:ferrous iron transport protein A [Alteromonadaceae bacterium 2753L.S.0a.02]|nr:ferrous iron transport protein A [Alteromonadaceae bacterium 2753L.S.0a.02]